MKTIFKILFLIVIGVPVAAQVVSGGGAIRTVSVEPSGSCSTAEVRQYAGTIYTCQSGSWAASTGGSVADASTTVKGKAEIATQAEVETRTDTSRIVTPALVATQRGKLRAYTYANLITYTSTYPDGATVENGDLVKATTGNRDYYRFNSTTSKWVSVNGGIFNVKDFGAVGDNSNDDTTAIQAAVDAGVQGSIVYFPPGIYKITATIDLPTPRILRGAGSTPSALGTEIRGSFTDYLITADFALSNVGGFGVEHLSLKNNNTSAGGGVYINSIIAPSWIRDCNIQAYRGITAYFDVYTLSIDNCHIVGIDTGNQAGSWGIYVGPGHVNIHSVDVTLCENGVRIAGMTTIVGGRFEVNKVGIVVGRDSTGGSQNGGGTIKNVTFEANDDAIQMLAAVAWSIENCTVLGSATGAAPSGNGQNGITVGATNPGSITNVTLNGTYEDTGALIISGPVTFKNVTSTTDAGVAWTVNNPTECTFENTNYNSATSGQVQIGGTITAATLLARAASADLGSTAKPYRDLYLYGSGTYGTHYLKFTGTPTSTRTQTFPDNTGTVANLNLAQTWSALQTFSTSPASPGGGSNSERWGFNASTGSTTNSYASGYGATVGGNSSTAVGRAATTGTGTLNISLGYNATLSNSIDGGVLIGADGVMSAGSNSLGIGRSVNVGHSASVALGFLATTTADNQLVIGGTNSSLGITTAYIGDGVTNATPVGFTLNATGGSGTNITGATLKIAGGKGTGTGNSGSVHLQTSTKLTSGTTLQTLVDRLVVNGANKTLTDASDTDLFDATLANGSYTGGTIEATIYASDGTDFQTRTVYLTWQAVNKAGTITSSVTVASETAAVSAGTLTATWGVTNGTGKITIKVNADSSLTTTSFYVRYKIVNNGEQAIAIL